MISTSHLISRHVLGGHARNRQAIGAADNVLMTREDATHGVGRFLVLLRVVVGVVEVRTGGNKGVSRDS